MDIFLDKEILGDINKSSEIEWIEKNDFGFYSSTSCLGMNTRREHGLFVVPDTSQKKKIVLLSKLEESVFIDKRLHEISTNHYNTGIFPAGYNYLNKFTMNPFPRYTFEIEDRIIEKTVFLLSNFPILIVRYELKNMGAPVNIIIKPFIAERYSTEVTKELQGLNTDSYLGQNFVRWSLKPNMPEVYAYYSTGEFIAANLWYKNFVYPKDVGKYYNNLNEHLFNPGFFQAKLNAYQSMDIYISTKELDIRNLDYESFYRTEFNDRKYENSVFESENRFIRMNQSLKKSIKIFNDKPLVSVSSMENVFTTRDIIFSLPGLFFTNQDYDNFKIHFYALTEQLSEGLLPVHSPLVRDKNHFCAADLSLWLINLGYTYFTLTQDIEFFGDQIMNCFQSVFDFYLKGTLHNIYVDKDKLVFSGNKNSSTSWIPLTDKKNEILRYGKLMEINALWYNAVKIYAKLNEALGKKWKTSKYTKLAEKIKLAFNETFVNKDSSILDFVHNNTKNKDFRINQIIPLALPFSVIDNHVAKLVLDQIEKDLLTPYGLRSAKIKKDLKEKILHRKSPAYYGGAIWPWTLGLYVDAAVKYSENPRKKAEKLKKYFEPVAQLIDDGLINYIPEVILSGDSVMQFGIADFTPSLSCSIWGCYQLNQMINN